MSFTLCMAKSRHKKRAANQPPWKVGNAFYRGAYGDVQQLGVRDRPSALEPPVSGCSFPCRGKERRGGTIRSSRVVRRVMGPMVPPRDPGFWAPGERAACRWGLVPPLEYRAPANLTATCGAVLERSGVDPPSCSATRADHGLRLRRTLGAGSLTHRSRYPPPDVERPPHHPASPRRSLVMTSLPARG
jgi:hypothetical protein